jgi:hypothetical protein
MAGENPRNPVDKTGDARATPGYIAAVKRTRDEHSDTPGAGPDMVRRISP